MIDRRILAANRAPALPRFSAGPSRLFLAALGLAAGLFVHDHAIAQVSAQVSAPAPAQVQPPAVSPQSAPQAQPAPPQAPPAAPRAKEGFFDALGKWWDQGAADFDANLKKMKSQMEQTHERNTQAAKDAAGAAAAATKEAADALAKFPTTRIIEGRERCLLAPNGSPDCNAAAESICKGKGFKSGQSANIESARKCSARALLTRNEEDCVNETIVTRAACQ